ncbi:hypothetical protein L1887_50381 [Cichorium endivia]|nr:hypothetical protein L1887_50381 [Cichorium endivia]
MDNRVRRGRENASSQCSSTRRYGAEVTHAILPGKARTAFNKRVPVPETDTERPYEASLFPGIGFGLFLRSLGGGRRRPPSGGVRAISEIHSGRARILTLCQDVRAKGQSQVSSGRTEIGPRVQGRGSLTARPTRRAGTKVGLSDPTVPSGRAVAQPDKSYSRDNRLIFPKSSHRREVWHLDVGSSPPGAVVCSKGWAVRPLKRYVSWVQNVVRQFGPYPVWALEH